MCNQSDALDDHASQLLVRLSKVSLENLEEYGHALVKVLGEGVSSCFCCGSNGSDGTLFDY